YKLVWKNRTGFARLAMTHGYPILPLASVGPDNAFSILLDADDFMVSRLGRLAQKIPGMSRLLRDGEAVPPIARGLAFTPIPRPERFYFSFGRPISTKKYQGRENDPEALMELRKKVEDSINEQLGRLLLMREQDTDKGLVRRILTSL
ncbi:MAG: acyltransferase, partial [Proteobacteria bacterium]|nr:acyltransferase [Pseudomonadota bacterium]